jgi:hypothetical protein
MGHYMGCGLQVENGWIGGRTVGFENDTEVAKVAKKDACVLGVVSLKRECSRFFSNGRSQGQSSTAGDVHRRGLIVEGWAGLSLRGYV